MSDRKTPPAPHDEEETQNAPRGRPVGDREARRKELLSAAASVIAREGYTKASLRAVAEHAGQSTGAVTYYFANKEELIAALMESVFDHFDSILESVRESTDVRMLFQHWLALAERNEMFWPVTSELFAKGRREPAFAEIIARRYERYRRVHTSILKAGQQRGTVRTDIPADLLTDQLCAMGDGWMLMYSVEPTRFTPKRIRVLIEAVCTLIAPPPSA